MVGDGAYWALGKRTSLSLFTARNSQWLVLSGLPSEGKAMEIYSRSPAKRSLSQMQEEGLECRLTKHIERQPPLARSILLRGSRHKSLFQMSDQMTKDGKDGDVVAAFRLLVDDRIFNATRATLRECRYTDE